MQIEQTKPEDLPAILQLYRNARRFMQQNGNPEQWKDTYPPEELVRQDIARGISYVCREQDEILCTFVYFAGHETDYDQIEDGEWLPGGAYGVVHRVASSGEKKGTASFCLDWAFRQCGDLRIDTHGDNLPMQKLLEKNRFSRRGIVHVQNGGERIAYQKVHFPVPSKNNNPSARS